MQDLIKVICEILLGEEISGNETIEETTNKLLELKSTLQCHSVETEISINELLEKCTGVTSYMTGKE